ncbi:MAG: putative glycosyltransferase [Gemmatimonadetes bacterium]|nr:putative glycosyltransferase [Gemmatimonadota bacterium]
MFGPTTVAPALSLVIPVYNAAEQLPATLGSVDDFATRYQDRLEVIFVDDCSTEVETQLILEDFARRSGYARVLRNAHNRGKGFSVTRGMLAARGRYRVFTDVDLAYPLDQVHKIVEELSNGSDVAIACRVLPESRYLMSPSFFHYLYTRHLMSRAFNKVVQTFLLPGILDTQAGLKGFTADAAELCFSRATIPGFGFDIECLYIAQQHRLTIKQTAVSFRYDDEPTTVRFARDSSRMLQDIWQVRTNAWRGQYVAGTPRFVFPAEDQWAAGVHTPPHGIPQSTSADRSLASA